MLNRHRQDEFIGALIFSLSINLLIVFALLTLRPEKKTAGISTFVVSIEASRPAAPRASATIVRAHTIIAPTPALTKKVKNRPIPLPPRVSKAAVLVPVERSATTVIKPEAPVASDKQGAGLLRLGGKSRTTATTAASTGSSTLAREVMAKETYTPPQRLAGVDPLYPKRAERNGWEGTVLLTLSIQANGEVERVSVAKTSGYELLDRSAGTAIASWRFKPAQSNGIAVAATVQLPIIFRRAVLGYKR